ncbi:hypothetical protein GCM10010331_15360 [Streptomyces xanthochromogenes]|uniref:DUF6286 domain-containing Asp23/Gls24 family envelope stress response protein n=1 Tax=Streptomyces xanthochromogenes TaxID=67384 RepID=UPI0016752EA6|nr:DUF6286 domain-containing Asp23/Gls24 family envelope stress response protein [Streptomyces xanthochromogenes]GHB29927.1 hypothetical protein GCM10010331_15360 [Streptomyces xanthochromogenes]
MTAAAARGSTTIADKAVRKIAERAAQEALAAPTADRPRGSAAVDGRRATVALRVALPYPAALSDTARRMQEHVAARTRHLTGLDVAPPRLTVTRLEARNAAPEPAAQEASKTGSSRRRWWSARRVPAAGLILLAGAACAAVTIDVIRVHTTGQGAGAWRASAVDRLAGLRVDNVGVTVAALAAAALGVVSLVLAFTPGRRRLLALATDSACQSVVIDRFTVATLVRDAVGCVDGVEEVRVRVRRRRITVKARLAFGDQESAQRRSVSAAERALDRCRLRRSLRCSVTVRPTPAWQAPHPDSSDPVAVDEKGRTA